MLYFTLYMANPNYNSNVCHLQKFFDGSAIAAYISKGDKQESTWIWFGKTIQGLHSFRYLGCAH